MNRLKSIFICALPAYLAIAAGFGITGALRSDARFLAWLGLALAALAPLGFGIWIALTKPVQTHRHPVAVSVVSGLGLAISMTASWRYGSAAGSAHVWAGLALIGWFAFLRWYSDLGPPPALAVRPGEQLPRFFLEDTSGGLVGSGTLQGRTRVLVFYHGNWCPFCAAQIHAFANRYQDFENAGVELVLISSQPLDRIRQLESRYDVPLTFLYDPDNAAARSLGIAYPCAVPCGLQALGYLSESVRPSILVIGPNGSLIHLDITDNIRSRLHPEALLSVLRGAPTLAQSRDG